MVPKLVRLVRGIVYRRGYFPKPGTILFSPSLDLVYQVKKAKIQEAFKQGVEMGIHGWLDEAERLDPGSVIDLLEVKVEIVHIVRSEDDQVTLCTGVPYRLPPMKAGTTMKLCEECRAGVFKKKE